VYTVVFEAGMDGIARKIDPGEPVDVNIYHLGETERKKLGVGVLPTSLKEALEEWKSDEICVKALGKEIAEKYAECKTQEWQEYQSHLPENKNEVSSWEKQKYLYA
jgi:glutamine synthetase